MLKVTVRLFGEFRQFFNGNETELHLPIGATLEGLRDALRAAIVEQGLGLSDFSFIGRAAFATEEEMLNSDFVFERDTTLAVLPPMCGG